MEAMNILFLGTVIYWDSLHFWVIALSFLYLLSKSWICCPDIVGCVNEALVTESWGHLDLLLISFFFFAAVCGFILQLLLHIVPHIDSASMQKHTGFVICRIVFAISYYLTFSVSLCSA